MCAILEQGVWISLPQNILRNKLLRYYVPDLWTPEDLGTAKMARNSSIGGIVLVLIGALLLANSFHIRLFHLALPALLIVLGIWLIYRKSQREEYRQSNADYRYNAETGTYTATFTAADGTTRASATVHSTEPSSDEPRKHQQGPGRTGEHKFSESPRSVGTKVKYSKFLGDMYISLDNINLQNVEISVAAGDLEVNLAGGKLQSGLNRMIISGFLGNCIILIPKDMPVFVHCSGFIGDVDLLGKRGTGFGNAMDSQSPDYDTAQSKLYIAANNFVGDIRVYRT